MITIDQLRKAFAHLPNSKIQIPMNPLKNLGAPAVSAVTQTLVGERMTKEVSFPTTGDPDCDFIQGVLAVKAAVADMWPGRAEILLRYLAERFKNIEDNQKQPSQPDIASLVRMHVQQYLQEQALRQQQAAPWYGQTSAAPPVCPPPYSTSAGDPFNGMSEFQVKAVMDSIRK